MAIPIVMIMIALMCVCGVVKMVTESMAEN